LVALRPDVIVTANSQAIKALRERTDTISIVMVGPADHPSVASNLKK
jgi:hypothetical protein